MKKRRDDVDMQGIERYGAKLVPNFGKGNASQVGSRKPKSPQGSYTPANVGVGTSPKKRG